MKKASQTALRSLWAFCIFAVLVLALRHVAADHRQETRIEALEIQLQQLASILEQQEAYLADFDSLRVAGESLPAPREHAAPAQTGNQARYTGRRRTAGVSAPAAESETLAERAERVAERMTQEDRKFSAPVRLELNAIDSLTLVRVPGIGATTAYVILRYRDKLGGFSSPEQLRECIRWESAQQHLDEWIEEWFKADEFLIKKVDVNHLSFKELVHHPYLNYEQVSQLCRRREKVGSMRSLDELSQLDAFGEEDLKRLAPYLRFE